jgi:pimeloyl-ACP methyl ester carboxylesterase
MIRQTDVMIPGPEGRLSVRTKGMDGAGRVAVLVQGSNLSGQTGYDFQYPPDNSYSLMDAVCARGFGAVTFSLRGYGKSDPPAAPLDVRTEEAIDDLAAVIDWLAAQGRATVDLIGWSWGCRINGHFAARHPERVRRLVFMGPAFGGGALITPGPTEDEAWWTNTRADYEKRLSVELMDLSARNAFIDSLLAYDPRAPNGIRAENAEGSVRVDPSLIQCPVLMLYGSEGGKQSYMQGNIARTDFFEALPAKEKALFVMPDGGDYGHLQHPRRKYHAAIAQFLESD